MLILPRNRFALKEWEPVCDRLGRGADVLVLRKGGLLETGFHVDHREFFLFPTRFHAKGEEPPARVDLRWYARVEDDLPVTELSVARRLEGLHAVPWEDVERRFHYGKQPGLHAIVLRTWRLERPPAVEDARAYDGCRSWVELRDELPVGEALPALDEAAFDARRNAVREALRG